MEDFEQTNKAKNIKFFFSVSIAEKLCLLRDIEIKIDLELKEVHEQLAACQNEYLLSGIFHNYELISKHQLGDLTLRGLIFLAYKKFGFDKPPFEEHEIISRAYGHQRNGKLYIDGYLSDENFKSKLVRHLAISCCRSCEKIFCPQNCLQLKK